MDINFSKLIFLRQQALFWLKNHHPQEGQITDYIYDIACRVLQPQLQSIDIYIFYRLLLYYRRKYNHRGVLWK